MLVGKKKDRDYLPGSNIRWKQNDDVMRKFPHSYQSYNPSDMKNDRTSSSVLKSGAPVYYGGGAVVYDKPILIEIGDKSIYLPIELANIAEAILEARDVLNLKDNWDEEGAVATDFETFKKAIDFLVLYSKSILKYGVIEKPFIDILRDGSLSILWETAKGSLLIIFKKGNKEFSYFYGEEKSKKVPFKYAVENGKEVDEIVALWMKRFLI